MESYTLGAYPTASTWTHISIVLSHTGSQASSSSNASGYINGVILSTTTKQDVFFEDDPTNTFLLGGSWENGVISPSFNGHMFDVRISNMALSSTNLELSAAKIGTGTCSCDLCYNESSTVTHCLSPCDLGQYSETIGATC